MLTCFAAASEKRHEETKATIREQKTMMREQQTLLRNQQASILSIEKQLGQLAKQMNERSLGGLLGNTEQNLKGAHIQTVTTRSGEIITYLTPINKNNSDVEQEVREERQRKETEQSLRRGSDATMWQDSEKKHSEPVKPYYPPLPFPSRAIQEKNAEDHQKFLDHIKSLEINIPFLEALDEMPKYAKFLKDMLTNRKKMEGLSKVILNETCSAAMLNMLPKKMGDPGSITLPCHLGNITTSHALVDLGASVNLMPYLFFKKLDLPKPRPVRMVIHLANKTMTFPRDFIVLDMEEDEQVPIILGRINDDMAFSVDDVLEKELRGWKEKETEGYMVLGDGDFDAEIDIKELVKLLEESEYCEVKKEAEEAT
ncbi:hypothetical protein Lser_V15G20375 [Lactuca serriola]